MAKFSSGHKAQRITGKSESKACIELTSKLLAIDGLATSAIALGKVAALEHEAGDDTVEVGLSVAIAILAGGQLTEVASGLGDLIVVKLEDDAAGGLLVDMDIELQCKM